MGEPVDGWVKCPKCGKAQFVGEPAPAKAEPEAEAEGEKAEGEE